MVDMTRTDDQDPQEPRWLSDEEQQLWRRWLLAGTRIQASLARQMQRDSGISMADYEVLVNLSEAPGHRMRIAALADRLQWDRSRLSHQITRMRNRELVDREACGDDRRGAFIVLTPTGLEVIAEAAPGHVKTVRELFIDRLSPAQATELSAILGDLLTQFEIPPECLGEK
jgi:DNA-binding MarR family transcriptional regulator|nr:MarR family transcriptional regulator [Corynebacterium sp.]